jgi:Predicted membrane protein (DUF2207)
VVRVYAYATNTDLQLQGLGEPRSCRDANPANVCEARARRHKMNFGDNAFSYEVAAAAWFVVLMSYVFVIMIAGRRGKPHVAVASYIPPVDISPAVAAWLLARGDMPRAVAAALVNMAAKGYVKLEQSSDLVSVMQVQGGSGQNLEPEEDALQHVLFRGYDCFDFDEGSKQLNEALKAFRTAMMNRGFSSGGGAPLVGGWVLSVAFAFVFLTTLGYTGPYERPRAMALVASLLITAGSLAMAMRTLPGALAKVATRMPWSTAPRRPWSGADTLPFSFLFVACGGLGGLAILDSTPAALIIAALLALNALLTGVIQRRTQAGREVLARLADYKEYLGKVEADSISRTNVADRVPEKLTTQQAYAIALDVDQGWGEQLVGSISDVVESSDLYFGQEPSDLQMGRHA